VGEYYPKKDKNFMNILDFLLDLGKIFHIFSKREPTIASAGLKKQEKNQ